MKKLTCALLVVFYLMFSGYCLAAQKKGKKEKEESQISLVNRAFDAGISMNEFKPWELVIANTEYDAALFTERKVNERSNDASQVDFKNNIMYWYERIWVGTVPQKIVLLQKVAPILQGAKPKTKFEVRGLFKNQLLAIINGDGSVEVKQ